MSSSLVLGDVIHRFEGDLRLGAGGGLTSAQDTILSTLVRCRTAVLGGHLYACDQCGAELVAYNGCGNRHCPSCLGSKSAAWLAEREQELLPVPYFHVVFTVPEEVGRLALGNKKVVYGILFRAAAETLLTLGADSKHLGAQLGFLAILHTWTQTLGHHPHIHCVVPGGGLSPDGASWVPTRRPDFLLPIPVLRRLYRGKFLAFLDAAFRDGELTFAGSTAAIAEHTEWKRWLGSLRSKEWVVYAKPPFGSPAQVLKYLARYTHRVAISNSRLLSMDDGTVRFSYRDRAHGNRRRVMALPGAEFLRRFLLHILPHAFVRIRYFGLMANCHRAEHLAKARVLLTVSERASIAAAPQADTEQAAAPSMPACPFCGNGHLRLRGEIAAESALTSSIALATWPRRDTS